jgi:uncharacterized phiE125 gp8 family phage protein
MLRSADVRVVVQPTAEPVTLAEAKFHLRLITDPADTTPHPEDAYVAALITVARQAAEDFMNRPVAQATFELRRWCFEGELPVAPVQSIVSVSYVDSLGVTQEVAAEEYELAGPIAAPYIRPAEGVYFPNPMRRDDAVRIRFVAGYGGDVPLPATIRHAILILVHHYYENREALVIGTVVNELSLSVRALLWPHRTQLGV